MTIPPFDTETIKVSDHFFRSIFFINASRQADNIDAFNWLILASIYPARAIVEIVYDSLKQGILSKDCDEFLKEARENVRRFRVIESIRVQDFHRGPIRFSPNSMSFSGPAKLSTSKQAHSAVGLSFDPETGKPVEQKFRNASIKYSRPVVINGLNVHDADLDEMVQIDIAVEDYLIDLKYFLEGYHSSFEKPMSRFFQDKPKPPKG